MEAASGGVGGERVSFSRLLWVGPLTVVAGVIVNVLVRTVAVSVFGIGGGFLPLGVGPTVFFTVGGVLGAVVVFALVARFARAPIRLFRRVAIIALAVSLIPDILLLFASPIPDTTFPAVLTLMVEHVAAWAVSVGMLTTLTRAR